jgi:hypothetical protein
MAADVIAFMDALQLTEKVRLVGFSMGGERPRPPLITHITPFELTRLGHDVHTPQ